MLLHTTLTVLEVGSAKIARGNKNPCLPKLDVQTEQFFSSPFFVLLVHTLVRVMDRRIGRD
jgi:hypothetical protein